MRPLLPWTANSLLSLACTDLPRGFDGINNCQPKFAHGQCVEDLRLAGALSPHVCMSCIAI